VRVSTQIEDRGNELVDAVPLLVGNLCRLSRFVDAVKFLHGRLEEKEEQNCTNLSYGFSADARS